jgi:hypothetical protein
VGTDSGVGRTYSIGKERIVKGEFAVQLWLLESKASDPSLTAGVARALNSKIYCDARKRSILLCEADPELHALLTSDPLEVNNQRRWASTDD